MKNSPCPQSRLRIALMAVWAMLGLVMAAVLVSTAFAEADGPDYFAVTGVAANDVLNIRSGPSARDRIVGTIPPKGGGIRNLGCQGGLSFDEWRTASEAQREAGKNRRWCRIEYRDVEGWVAGRFLAEDSGGSRVADSAADGAAAKPSFSCAKADTDAMAAICTDGALAELDVELARLYNLAIDGPHMRADRRAELVAEQRGWIKGRDDCWKSRLSLQDCVAYSYASRIHELRTLYFDSRQEQGRSTGPFPYICEGLDAIVSAAFVNTGEPMVSLLWLQNALVLPLVSSRSGSKYAADHWRTVDQGEPNRPTVFWAKGQDATLSLAGGPVMACRRDSSG